MGVLRRYHSENAPTGKFDIFGLASCDEYLINAYRTGEIDWKSYMDCLFYRQLKPSVIMATQSFGECFKCTTTCSLDVLLDSAKLTGARYLAKKAVEQELKIKAFAFAQRYFKKALPVIGQVDTALTAFGLARCTTSCLASSMKQLQ